MDRRTVSRPERRSRHRRVAVAEWPAVAARRLVRRGGAVRRPPIDVARDQKGQAARPVPQVPYNTPLREGDGGLSLARQGQLTPLSRRVPRRGRRTPQEDATPRGLTSCVVKLTMGDLRSSIRTDSDTSRRMARVRQRDTAAEQLVREGLRQLGLRFRTENRDLPGSPDIANRPKRWVVFV